MPSVLFAETHVWEDWSSWSSCSLRDGSKAECWKDYNDPPITERRRVCKIKGNPQICNLEKETCTNLPTCPIGKIC